MLSTSTFWLGEDLGFPPSIWESHSKRNAGGFKDWCRNGHVLSFKRYFHKLAGKDVGKKHRCTATSVFFCISCSSFYSNLLVLGKWIHDFNLTRQPSLYWGSGSPWPPGTQATEGVVLSTEEDPAEQSEEPGDGPSFCGFCLGVPGYEKATCFVG